MTLHSEGDRRRNATKIRVQFISEAHPGVSLDCFHQPCLHALSPVRCVTEVYTVAGRFRRCASLNSSRPTPERLLLQAQAEENKRWGAPLEIFLGYAPGVGKSYRVLDEARRRQE